MADFLPPVIEEFVADVARYVIPLGDAVKVARDFRTANYEAIISLRDLDGQMLAAAAAADALAARENDLASALDRVAPMAGELASQLQDVFDSLLAAGEATSSLNRRFGSLFDRSVELTLGLRLLDAELDKKAAALAAVGVTGGLAGVGVAALGRAAGNANTGFRLWGTGIRLTGTAIHWLLSGTAELLAVLIPAAVAAGAWAAAWIQGATNVVQHMNAVYTATEAMANAGARTAGQMIGLGRALQQAQNQANPDVYQALGGAIDLVRESAGGLAQVGVHVGRIFDTFMGRVVYDFSAAGGASKTLNSVLGAMIPDLVEIGQVFGNLGRAIMLFASQMPGLAEVLLGTLAGFTDLVKVILEFTNTLGQAGFPILTIVMALEEVNRWGGAIAGLFGRMGLAADRATGGFLSVGRAFSTIGIIVKALPMAFAALISNIGSLISGYGRLGGAMGRAGDAVRFFGADMTDAVAAFPAWQAALIGLAAAGLGFLIYKMIQAKSAAQQFADSLQQAVEKASNLKVLSVIGSNIDALTRKINADNQVLATAQGVMARAGYSAGALGYGLTRQGYAAIAASDNNAVYSKSLTQQVSDAANVVQGAQTIARMYGVSVPAAMALASSAGVNLSSKITTQSGALNALGKKIANAVAGYRAMGVSSGALGSDMLAVAIQAGLAGTKVSQLNQAWDSFMQNMTGGTSGMSQFEESLQNIGNIAVNTSNHLATSTGSMTLSTQQFAQALTHYTGTGAEAWSNFDQIMGSTLPQLADWFRTAAAEGAIHMGALNKSVLDMVAPMMKFAGSSKTAQAELVAFARQQGENINTFGQLKQAIKDSGASAADLGTKIDTTTAAMGNMSKVAQNLGDVMSGQVTAALSSAALKASGFYTDANNLTAALARNGTYGGHTATYWAQQTAAAFQKAGTDAAIAAGKVGHLSSTLASLRSKDITVAVRFVQTGSVPTVAGGGSGGGHIQVGSGPGGGAGSARGGIAAAPGVVVHVHGSVVATQDIARAVQTAMNQQTIRNGSTQLYIRGRLH